jgi:hypothetical protein
MLFVLLAPRFSLYSVYVLCLICSQIFATKEHKQKIAKFWEKINQRAESEYSQNLGASKPKNINRI